MREEDSSAKFSDEEKALKDETYILTDYSSRIQHLVSISIIEVR
jgi:hypothetical protein